MAEPRSPHARKRLSTVGDATPAFDCYYGIGGIHISPSNENATYNLILEYRPPITTEFPDEDWQLSDEYTQDSDKVIAHDFIGPFFVRIRLSEISTGHSVTVTLG